MALPVNVDKGTVNFLLMDTTGTFATGTLKFQPEFTALKNVSATPPTIILPAAVTVNLVDGAGSVELVATDDPDNNPQDWTYKVSASLGGGATLTSFSISVPSGSTQDLADLQPVTSSKGVATIVGPGVPAGGDAGQILQKNTSNDYDTSWVNAPEGTGGGGGGAITSVNGQVGVVVLSAADVGAMSSGYVPDWSDLTNKPASFPPDLHNHDDRYYTESEVDTLLANLDTGGGGGTELTDYSQVAGLPGYPTAFPSEAHNHDDRYYTESEVDDMLSAMPSTAMIYYNGSSWIDENDDAITIRPLAKRVQAFGATVQPAFLVAGDIWIEDTGA